MTKNKLDLARTYALLVADLRSVDPFTRLRAIRTLTAQGRTLQSTLREMERDTVRELRRNGATEAEIVERVGTSSVLERHRNDL